MVKLPKYICIKCGRGFTTARSGRRHVHNVESGQGYITTEAEYRVQILTGKIPPPIPQTPRVLNQSKKSVIEIGEEEFIRGFYHQMGKSAYEEIKSKPETIALKQFMFLRAALKN